MFEKNKIQEVVNKIVDEFNVENQGFGQIDKNHGSIIYGKGGVLDSVGLVNFVVAIEEGIESYLDRTIILGDDDAMSSENNPFKSIDNLIDYILFKLNS